MFQNDWFMREIENLSGAIAEVVFHKQHPKLERAVEQYSFDRDRLWTELMELVKNGDINHAEDILFNSIGNVSYDLSSLGDEFYDYLNTLDDNFLIKSGFPRIEIEQGLEDFQKAIDAMAATKTVASTDVVATVDTEK